jgi:hypothetical protein
MCANKHSSVHGFWPITTNLACNSAYNLQVNELLQHPAVVAHVQQYLDSLSAAGPGGWSTWRMKLPPQMLAQMASVIARSK